MSDELRSRLDAMATDELIEALRRHDLNEWRPEVFPIVESILQRRGVDVVALKARRPDVDGADAADAPDLVEVMDLPDPALIAVAKSLLEGAGIPFFIKNESTQGLFGWGQMGTGYNLITGPPTLMVEPSRLEEVRELLEALVREAGPKPETEDD